MGEIVVLLNGGTDEDNNFIFKNICDNIKDKIGMALNGSETVFFKAKPLKTDYNLERDIEITDEILSKKRPGLFRHLRMASSFENTVIGETQKYKIEIYVCLLDHFINIKIFDIVFDSLMERIPNTFEAICIYTPFDNDNKPVNFKPQKNDTYYILRNETAGLPEVDIKTSAD
ncbi:MAG: hypothetical protein KAR07_07210 [Spirochaetes bacterium]|nr:hypothetical protein [Spirochaetota bacterium]MCK5267937.1 hypothetical protein [Spirochaetota bacterium]